MSHYISSKRKLPEGTKTYKSGPKNVERSKTEILPLTRLKVGQSFASYDHFTVRSLGGNIYNKSRTRGMKFSARTIGDPTTDSYVVVWRIK